MGYTKLDELYDSLEQIEEELRNGAGDNVLALEDERRYILQEIKELED